MKDHVEIGHLTKYDAFRVNRDQAMNLEIRFKINANVSNLETGKVCIRAKWPITPELIPVSVA